MLSAGGMLTTEKLEPILVGVLYTALLTYGETRCCGKGRFNLTIEFKLEEAKMAGRLARILGLARARGLGARARAAAPRARAGGLGARRGAAGARGGAPRARARGLGARRGAAAPRGRGRGLAARRGLRG